MQRGQAAIGLGDQRAVDGFGHVVGEERGRQRILVLARLGAEDVAHDLRGKDSARGAFVALPRAPEGIEHELAVGAVLRLAMLDIARLIEPDALAVRERDRGKGQLGIGELAVDRVRAAGARRPRRRAPIPPRGRAYGVRRAACCREKKPWRSARLAFSRSKARTFASPRARISGASHAVFSPRIV